jgi:hypothetical protein
MVTHSLSRSQKILDTNQDTQSIPRTVSSRSFLRNYDTKSEPVRAQAHHRPSPMETPHSGNTIPASKRRCSQIATIDLRRGGRWQHPGFAGKEKASNPGPSPGKSLGKSRARNQGNLGRRLPSRKGRNSSRFNHMPSHICLAHTQVPVVQIHLPGHTFHLPLPDISALPRNTSSRLTAEAFSR